MILSTMYSSRGAPMGRHDQHEHGAENLAFELEWAPLVDGAYDCGGAYWGSPANLYCAEAQSEDSVVQLFVRAKDREQAMTMISEQYQGATFLPENGTLVKQTIEMYQAHLGRETSEEQIDHANDEIDGLRSLLEEKGLT